MIAALLTLVGVAGAILGVLYARKKLRGLRGSALLEAVLSLGALALILSAAFGSHALAEHGWSGLAVVLWGCGLAVFCSVLVRWAPPLEPPPGVDGPYQGGRPEGGRPGRK
jgi:hypothetical protein